MYHAASNGRAHAVATTKHIHTHTTVTHKPTNTGVSMHSLRTRLCCARCAVGPLRPRRHPLARLAAAASHARHIPRVARSGSLHELPWSAAGEYGPVQAAVQAQVQCTGSGAVGCTLRVKVHLPVHERVQATVGRQRCRFSEEAVVLWGACEGVGATGAWAQPSNLRMQDHAALTF